MSAVEKEILERLKALLVLGTRLHRLFLFGSRARGDADPDSDMDVVVVPVVFAREEWEDGPESQSLLAQAVAAEGILV